MPARSPSLLTDPEALWHRHWFVWFIRAAAVLMVTALAVGLYFNSYPNVPQRSDFTLFYASALAATQGESLFRHFIYAPFLGHIVFLAPLGQPDTHRLMENLNPPVVTFLLLPFSAYELRTAYLLWCASQFTLALLLIWRVLAALNWQHPLVKPGSALWLTVYYPVLANLLIGQIGLFLFAICAALWLALDRGHERLAGIALGAALLLKLFIGFVFLWFLVQRRWTILWWGALVWALGMLAALLVFGADDHLRWLKILDLYSAGSLSWNASLSGVCERYFGAGITAGILESPWLFWLLTSLGYILAGGGLLALGRWSAPLSVRNRSLLGLAFALPVMLLVAPLGWLYYFPVLLLSAATLWQLSRPLPSATGLRSGLIVTLMLSTVPQILTAGQNLHWELWHTYYQDGVFDTRNGETVFLYEGTYHWFVLPEIYTLSLILMALMALRTAYRLRSTQTGA